MLAYIFAGIALGSIYAIAAAGIVVIYVSAGVLNFAFGSMAYFLARFYYYLNTQRGWDQFPAVVVAIGLAGRCSVRSCMWCCSATFACPPRSSRSSRPSASRSRCLLWL